MCTNSSFENTILREPETACVEPDKQQKLMWQSEESQRRSAEAGANRKFAFTRKQMTRPSRVCVISNVVSFGKDIYKISMTRRRLLKKSN